MIENIKIINQLFAVQAVLEKTGTKKVFENDSLTVSLYKLLKIISEGADTIFKMKKYSSESAPSLTQKIKKLENLGFVSRKPDKLDGRRWEFMSTKKGKAVVKKVEEKITKVSSKLFSSYSEKEKKIFTRILEDVELFFKERVN